MCSKTARVISQFSNVLYHNGENYFRQIYIFKQVCLHLNDNVFYVYSMRKRVQEKFI